MSDKGDPSSTSTGIDNQKIVKESTKKFKHCGKSLLSEQLAKYKSSKDLKPVRKQNEEMIFKKLENFKNKIRQKSNDEKSTHQTKSKSSDVLNKDELNKSVESCKLHGLINCNSCEKTKQSDNTNNSDIRDINSGVWMKHKLSFIESSSKQSFSHKVDDYLVIDPREQEKTFLKKKKKAQ
ncbi:hypothetical protein BB561_000995 [Smittium simulii]|nr:hypothetical protein BB561_000995 [Smittium simulii]